VLFWVDRWALTPKYHDIMDLPLPVCLGVGLFQCLALIPGTSRSGATIVGAMLLGADKRSSAEFSFFLAMPVMFGAFVFDLLKNRDALSAADLPVIATGFIAAFVVAIFVVRYLVDYVSRHGFVVFAWWRVIVGVLGLAALFIWG
jgi:undecaprenyl-diphosphatase